MLNKDDVIRLARQVSNTPLDAISTPDLFGVNQIVAFAKLVAEHEREACAKLCEEYQNPFEGKAMAEAIRARGQV